MKFVRFTEAGRTRIGKLDGNRVVDLSGIPGVIDSMRHLLGRLTELRPALEAANAPAYPLSAVRLENPVNDPQKYLAIGLNYKAHAEEARAAGIPIPTSQLWFNKQVSCLTGPYDPILFPSAVKQLDYEIELGVVIGQRCRNVKASDARAVIAGYLVTNDVSAQLKQHFADKLYDAVIPRNVRLAEAPSYGMPALVYDKQSRGALAYLALAGEVVRRQRSKANSVPA